MTDMANIPAPSLGPHKATVLLQLEDSPVMNSLGQIIVEVRDVTMHSDTWECDVSLELIAGGLRAIADELLARSAELEQ